MSKTEKSRNSLNKLLSGLKNGIEKNAMHSAVIMDAKKRHVSPDPTIMYEQEQIHSQPYKVDGWQVAELG